MRTRAIAGAFLLLISSGHSARAEDQSVLRGGSYAVEVQLGLPHLEDMNAKKLAMVCLTADPGSNNHGFLVLSDNNPLTKCPVSNIRDTGATLSFEIVCEGVNQARALATYQLAAETFRGRIEMKMGGKNMTMTEIQSGHRIGECAPPGSPPS